MHFHTISRHVQNLSHRWVADPRVAHSQWAHICNDTSQPTYAIGPIPDGKQPANQPRLVCDVDPQVAVNGTQCVWTGINSSLV